MRLVKQLTGWSSSAPGMFVLVLCFFFLRGCIFGLFESIFYNIHVRYIIVYTINIYIYIYYMMYVKGACVYIYIYAHVHYS